jgi:hypothetical protein
MKGLPLTLLLAGLVTLAGCSSTNYDRYGRRSDGPVYGRSGTYNYPAHARTGGSGANARYRVCHRDRNTLTLPAPAVRAHLRHGDTFGDCGRNDRARHDRARHDRDDHRHEGRRGRDRDDDDRREARRGRDRDDDRGRRRGRGHGRGND